jgi:hypothetical protein
MGHRISRIFSFRRAPVVGAIIALLLPSYGTTTQAELGRPPYLANFPNFAPAVTPQMPGDVDIALKTELEKAKEFAKVQREFDLYSWQMFFAVNWPTNDQGRPAPRLEDTSFGAPHWTLWHNSSTIFQANGAPPDACGLPAEKRALVLTRNLTQPVSRGLEPFRLEANAAVNPRTTRFLGVISAVGELNVANLGSGIGQAFTGPLIDQNGNFVFYEIMIDPNEVNYLCEKKLYNINGQIDFSKSGGKVDMPTGHPAQQWSGSFELKLAWKILEPGKDDPSRFFAEDAYVMDQGPDGKPVQKKVKVGLVGMHIGHKSETSPQWIWATFEQVDNLDVDPVDHPKLHASFNDVNCPICTTNIQPQKGANGVYPRIPVQLSRTIPIPPDKVHLNAEVTTALSRSRSVWQYYQLIDTQWPTDPTAAPSAWDSGLAQAVTNKPGGQPTPVFLTNITMESYFQSGNQPACNQQEAVPASANCPAPYASVPPGTASAAYTPDPVYWTSPLNNGSGPVKPGISTQILATESCMGCHSSAGVWLTYDPQTKKGTQSGQLTADFSWLLSQKASWAPVP